MAEQGQPTTQKINNAVGEMTSAPEWSQGSIREQARKNVAAGTVPAHNEYAIPTNIRPDNDAGSSKKNRT